MKYIKVLAYNEYSVFEVIEEYEKTIQCKLTNCENGYIVIGKNNVLAQADTIEELCDGFYIDDKLLNRFNKYAMFEKDQYEKFKDITITYTKGKIPLVAYGFVKTDKGLIYVAKMDSEGKLVLM